MHWSHTVFEFSCLFTAIMHVHTCIVLLYFVQCDYIDLYILCIHKCLIQWHKRVCNNFIFIDKIMQVANIHIYTTLWVSVHAVPITMVFFSSYTCKEYGLLTLMSWQSNLIE